jgi:hypothetical protein
MPHEFGLPIALIVRGLLGAPLPSQNPPTPRRP